MVFRLARMQAWLAVLTWALLLLPALFIDRATSAPPPVNAILVGTAVFMVLVYASVWLAFRPTRFEVGPSELRIVWPVWSRTIALADVVSARIMSGADFRREYGLGMRIGAGGLWGGFGLLKTSRETFSMWISRTDRFVLVELRGARTLMVTPEDPERFVASLTR